MEATVPSSPEKDSADKTTLERVRETQNMSPKQIRDYLSSDEFKHHGSKAVERNARRLLTLTSGDKKQVSLEDRSLLRGALSAMERAKHTGDSGDELAASICKSKAYGYDPEAGGDEADYGAQSAQASGEAEPSDDGGDDDQEEEEDTGAD